jgi:hypothetical protein
MKIKILVSCSGDKFSYTPGQIVDAGETLAKDLIAAKYAEEIKEAKPPKPKGGAGGAET